MQRRKSPCDRGASRQGFISTLQMDAGAGRGAGCSALRTWSSNGLTPRERSMITLCLLAALGHWDEFQMHLRATSNTGASVDDIAEVLMHVAIYAGVPAANHAIEQTKATFATDETPASGEAQ